MPIRIVLFSEVNSKFGSPILTRLLNYPDIDLVGLVTSPDGTLCDYYVDEPDPVDLAAIGETAGVVTLRPPKVNNSGVVTRLRRLRADYFVIGNYQQILGQDMLDVPAEGTINFHPSPLPRYAGLAPFFWMAKHGEHDGGVSAVWTTTEIDGGPLIAQRQVVLKGTETAGRVRDLHFQASWQLVEDVLPMLLNRSYELRPQNLTQRSHFGQPDEQGYCLDWTASTDHVLRTVRASLPVPGALTIADSGYPLRIMAIRSKPNLGSTGAEPGSVRRGQDGAAEVRTGDGWVSLDKIRLGDSRDAPITPVTNLPALPTMLRSATAQADASRTLSA